MFKTIKSALASVTCDTKCTCCGKPASSGYMNQASGEACVAMIHDNYSQGFRAQLIRKNWKGKKRQTGISGAGLLDRK